MSPPFGRFVWRDLMLSHPATMEAYYTGVFGWTVKKMPMPGVPGVDYPFWEIRGRPIGGYSLWEGPQAGSPAHWVAHLMVPEIQAACATIVELGGSITRPPTPIPGIGFFAFVKDPTGAAFSVFQSTQPERERAREEAPVPGDFCWSELTSTDPERAGNFYCQLVGWELRKMPAGEMPYAFFSHEGQDIGSLLATSGAGQASSWMDYVEVGDIEAAAARSTALGGQTLFPPHKISMGSIAVFRDPDGAPIGAYAPDKPAA